jgi:hypothetical protein
MSIRIALVALISAALLSSCSSSSDVRPEVARPLDEARVLANGGSDKAAIMAKLNQAASVPNLNKDERHQIRAIGEYALARPVNRYVATMPLQSDAGPAGGNGVGYTGLH